MQSLRVHWAGPGLMVSNAMERLGIPVLLSSGAMGVADLPPAVRTTLRREAATAKVEEIRKDGTATLVVYEIDASTGGQRFCLRIAEDGRRLAKKAIKRQYTVPLA